MRINSVTKYQAANSIFYGYGQGSKKDTSLKMEIQNYLQETRADQDLLTARKIYEMQIKKYREQSAKVRNIEELCRKMNEVNENRGFGRIAGYGKEKDILMQIVGSPIVLEKDGQHSNVPNGILFFGPKGNGKTVFAESFAQQLDCNLVKLEDAKNATENLQNIRKIAEEAQKNFEATGIRTMIQIDDFDSFVPKGSKIEGPLKVFIENLSKRYHCTVLAITSHPEHISDNVMTDSRFEVKLPIAPANKENLVAILKEYTRGIVSNDVDYNNIAELIELNEKEKAYSNMTLKQLIINAIKIRKGDKITPADFMKSILTTPKDISKEALELFKKQIEYIKHA